MSNNIRIEEDLLGTREVPAEAYYGVHTLRAIENFYISNNKISDIPEFVRGMVMVKKAAALANKELQTIPKSVANAIIVEFQDILKMGRTQLQDAVPMTLGQEFRAFSILLKEEVKNIQRTAELLLEVNLGATAIGTGLNTPKEYSPLAVKKLAEVTGFPCVPAEDLIEATSDCGAYVMVHSALKRLAVKMSKICNDLRLLSSGPRAGLNEINLPELQAGSSIMPAKVNPVVPEVVNQVCFKVIGNDTTVTMAAEAGQLQLNVMEPVIGQAMFESIHILSNACYNLLEKCVNGITANKEVCEGYVFNSIGIVTYLNPFIGHHNGDIVGKICAETGKSVREVVLERGLLTEAELDDIFSAQNLMHPAYKAKRYTDESEQ